MTPRCLWNYYRDEINDDANKNNDDDSGEIMKRKQQVNPLSIRQK